MKLDKGAQYMSCHYNSDTITIRKGREILYTCYYRVNAVRDEIFGNPPLTQQQCRVNFEEAQNTLYCLLAANFENGWIQQSCLHASDYIDVTYVRQPTRRKTLSPFMSFELDAKMNLKISIQSDKKRLGMLP